MAVIPVVTLGAWWPNRSGGSEIDYGHAFVIGESEVSGSSRTVAVGQDRT